jgi:hypothetical protein
LLLCAGGALASTTVPERTRHQVELFADLAPGDSIAALRRAAPDTLELDIISAVKGPVRKTRYFVPQPTLDKLIAGAGKQETVAVRESHTAPGKARIREDYMGGQLAASTYVYTVALVNGLGLQDERAILFPAFAVTASLAAHAIFSLNHPLDEARVLGMNYAAGGAIVSSYAAPFLAMGSSAETFRLGSLVSLAAYPLSLAPGYRYGGRFQDRPGDLSKKIYAAGVFAGTGAVLPWVYLGPEDDDLRWRMAAGQIFAFGAVGHFAADLYRPGVPLTEGVTTGIGTHTALGTLAGFALASSASGSRTKTGFVLGFALAGFGEGLLFFADRHDDADQANYSGLGMASGILLASAFALVSDASATTTLWAMTASGITGYALTYTIMDSRRAGRTRRANAETRENDFIRGVSLALAPVPELIRKVPGERIGQPGAGRVETRYSVPGLIVRF